MAGIVYDTAALNQLDKTLQYQQDQFKAIDNSKEIQKQNMFRYLAIFVGSAVLLIGLKIIISKK